MRFAFAVIPLTYILAQFIAKPAFGMIIVIVLGVLGELLIFMVNRTIVFVASEYLNRRLMFSDRDLQNLALKNSSQTV
jgi:hypothetical protein